MKPSRDEERGDSTRLYASLESSGEKQPAPPLGPVLFCVAVACAGSMAFGYHLGVVNGPLEAIAKDLGIAGNATLQGMIVSSTLAGAALGSLSGGNLADSLGRRKAMLLAAIPMLLGPLLSANAQAFNMMVAGRLVTGIAIGLSSALVPTYISEVAPTAIRGSLGTLNQLVICLGILAALAINVVTPVEAWRQMFVLGALPALVLGVGMLFSPESPRWLQVNGQSAAASKAAQALWGSRSETELGALPAGSKTSATSVAEPDMGLAEMFGLKTFQIGLLLFAFQQFAGINALVFFSTSVFRQAGVTSDTLASLAVGATNVLGTLIAASIIEKQGRTTLLTNSYMGQAAAMFAMAAGFTIPALKEFAAPIAVCGTLFYILSFALGAGPVTALIIAELNPAKIRGRAVAAAFVSHWVCNVIVGQTFMSGVQSFGLPAVYTFFGSMALLGALYIKTQVPETKGVELK